MKEKRRYERRPESLQMSVTSKTGETKTYTTRDVSDGGLFLYARAAEQLPVGTEVTIAPVRQVAGASPLAIKGRIVRANAQGMGIEFLEPRFT